MKALTLYKIQSCLYLLLIVFSLQHCFLKEYHYGFNGYERLVNGFLFTSVITVIASIFALIAESIISINRKEVRNDELKYLFFNLVLFYGTALSVLYLSGEIRPS